MRVRTPGDSRKKAGSDRHQFLFFRFHRVVHFLDVLVGELLDLVLGTPGLHVLDLIGDKRIAIQRFAEGITPTIEFAREIATGPPLGKVLAAARRLFTGVEENDPFGEERTAIEKLM